MHDPSFDSQRSNHLSTNLSSRGAKKKLVFSGPDENPHEKGRSAGIAIGPLFDRP